MLIKICILACYIIKTGFNHKKYNHGCYIFNSSNKFFLQIHFTRIIEMHFFKNNVSSFSFRHKFLNTLKNIDIEINVLLFF